VTIRLRNLHYSLTAFLLVALACSASRALGQGTNPVLIKLAYGYKDPNTGFFVQDFRPADPANGNGAWIPALKNWNGKFTKKNNKVENVNTDKMTFPYTNLGGVVVTAVMNDAYWENTNYPLNMYKNVKNFTGWDFNCYGFATSKNYWIQPNGWNSIAQDEYVVNNNTFCVQNSLLKPNYDHCFLLTACCAKGYNNQIDTIKTTQEKNQSSSVYEISYKCPPGLIANGASVYDPAK
jgi:hypothetical protein